MLDERIRNLEQSKAILDYILDNEFAELSAAISLPKPLPKEQEEINSEYITIVVPRKGNIVVNVCRDVLYLKGAKD
jgi:hypothetical protein